MLIKLIKPLIFIIITQTLNLAIANKLWASTHAKEIYLKQITERTEALLKDSMEAQAFLREDLQETSEVLKKAKFGWTKSLSSLPMLYGSEGQFKILLSDSYSFQGSAEARIITVLNILFHLKRQIDNSLLPVPELRIALFAKKFSPILSGKEVHSCLLSLYPIPFPLSPTQRKELHSRLLSLVKVKGFEYSSKWAQKVLWLEREDATDGECGGDNRNIATFKAHIMDFNSLKSMNVAEVTLTSCGYDDINTGLALTKILKRIKRNLPKCNNAFWI